MKLSKLVLAVAFLSASVSHAAGENVVQGVSSSAAGTLSSVTGIGTATATASHSTSGTATGTLTTNVTPSFTVTTNGVNSTRTITSATVNTSASSTSSSTINANLTGGGETFGVSGGNSVFGANVVATIPPL